MENALWNGQCYTAADVAESYELEKTIRKASERKELRCPDADCPSPILRYCHGKIIKSAYFAHLDNCTCDYAEFDKTNTPLIRMVKRIIYNSFASKGYDVQLEVKVVPKHYTHLLFTLSSGKKVAVELGTPRTTADKIEYLAEQYSAIGIDAQWIVINNAQTPAKENEAYFIERYRLNESKRKDVLVLSRDGTKITQYILDPNKYLYRGNPIRSNNYPEIYREVAGLDVLAFEEDELTIQGFHARYNEWLKKKRRAFEKKIAQCEAEEVAWRERQRREQTIRQSLYSNPTYRNQHYAYHCPTAEVGMKILHINYGELTIIEVNNSSEKSIIKVQYPSGEVSSMVWNILWANNMVTII